MKNTNGNLPAMPYPAKLLQDSDGLYTIHQTGLTKREQFAMEAMQGILSGNTLSALAEMAERNQHSSDEMLFKMAVKAADGLLAELER